MPGSGLLVAGRVVGPASPTWANAVWWENGLIRSVGPLEQVCEAAALHRRSEPPPRYELPGTLVTPGFIDGHTHFVMWALSRSSVDLAGASTRAAAVARVAKGTRVGGWIHGLGYDPNGWGAAPERAALDAVLPDVPVALESHDVHAMWLNTEALRRCGIDRATPDPEGGRIVRDAAGQPTGVLLERAVRLVRPHLPAVTGDGLTSAVRTVQAEAHRLGVTGIQDVEGRDALEAFQRLESDDRLRLRVLMHIPLDGLDDALAVGLRSGAGSQWITTGGVKMFLDGALGSQTAWMLEPYEGSRDCGIPLMSVAEARRATTRAAAGGLASVVHAIGDAAVRRALDLLEPLPRVAVPHRIEHLQLVHPRDLPRAARAGIVASMQPAHLLTDIPLVERHWGSRGSGAYACRSLLDARTRLVFGSDVPVETIDPRDGVYAALERQRRQGGPGGGWRPREKLTFQEALRAYSVEGWAAAGQGGRGGALAQDQAADLVAWECDLAAVLANDGSAFRAGSAALTVVGGDAVWRRS